VDWEDIKEGLGCLVWVVLMALIILVFTALPGIIDAVQHWSDSL